MTLTPRTRMATVQSGHCPDKLPLTMSAANSFICQYYGLSVTEYLTEASKAAQGHIALFEDFSFDGGVIASGYILYGCGPEMGVEWEYTESEFPGFSGGPLKEEADLESLTIPKSPSGHFAHYLDVIREVTNVLGSSHALMGNILGPFASFCFLRGIEQAFMDTLLNPSFFSKSLDFCTELSVYFGREVLATGVPNPILNEIFLTPQMISPEAYHRLIAPAIQRVQEALGHHQSPNVMGAFMGQSGDKDSQRGGRALYEAFFGVGESLEYIKAAFEYRLPSMPFPLTVSGRMLDSWPTEDVITYLKEGLDFLVGECGIYPSISLIAIQAESKQKASIVANKLKALGDFRDSYRPGK